MPRQDWMNLTDWLQKTHFDNWIDKKKRRRKQYLSFDLLCYGWYWFTSLRFSICADTNPVYDVGASRHFSTAPSSMRGSCLMWLLEFRSDSIVTTWFLAVTYTATYLHSYYYTLDINKKDGKCRNQMTVRCQLLTFLK